MTPKAVKLKCDASLLLASKTSALHKRLNIEIFYGPVTLLRSFTENSELSQKTKIKYQSLSRCIQCSHHKVKVLTDNVLPMHTTETFNLGHYREIITDDCCYCGKGQDHERIIRLQKTSSVIFVHFEAGLKDKNYHKTIITYEGVQDRLTELIQKEDYYHCWTLENKGKTFVNKIYFLVQAKPNMFR